jgi:DNA-binding response OmpR family regulator
MENKPLKLLVVDDEEGIVDFTKRIYSRKGFITFGAFDGITAVDIFQKERPHICLIDIHMPLSPFNGIETLKRIKEIDKDAICIMVTRITEQAAVEAAKRLGASAYLLKPLEMEEIDRAISEAAKINL